MGQRAVKNLTVEIHHRPPAEVVPIDAGGHRERVLDRRDELIIEHMDKIPAVARRLLRVLPPSWTLDDLIGPGQLALIDVATRYRPSQHPGCSFWLFASQRIRGAMLDAVRGPHRYRENNAAIDDAPEPATLPEMEASIDGQRLIERVAGAIHQLPAREREVVTRHYGPTEESLESVGRGLRISGERARQIRCAAIDHLRQLLRSAS